MRAPQPLPLGAIAMIGLGGAMMTNTLTFAQAFSAFSSEIPWCGLRGGARRRAACAAPGASTQRIPCQLGSAHVGVDPSA